MYALTGTFFLVEENYEVSFLNGLQYYLISCNECTVFTIL